MPRTGDTYTRPSGTTAIFGQPIDPAAHETEMDDVAQALSNSARLSRMQDIAGDLQTGGSGVAYTLTSHAGYSGLQNGLTLAFRAHADCAPNPTLNVDSIGTAPMRKVTSLGEAALVSKDLVTGGHYAAVYDTAANAGSGAWIVTGGIASSSGGGSGPSLGVTTGIAYSAASAVVSSTISRIFGI
jgi:hypothetical protein